jgi:hypothetical protein
MPTRRLRAATTAVIQSNKTIRTIYVDLGFGISGNRSCGLRATDGAFGTGRVVRACEFGELADLIREHSTGESNLLLVLEAPLSIRFDGSGNPCPREIDLRFGDGRDPGLYSWHRPIGHGLHGAARLLLGNLLADQGKPLIHLAEGFIADKSCPEYALVSEHARAIADHERLRLNSHTRDTIAMQLIHAKKIGHVDMSGSRGLDGCVSILTGLTGESIPPPVLCLRAPHSKMNQPERVRCDGPSPGESSATKSSSS